ncbi:hypothetical protein GQ457_03G042140 [Hibiscus cannabinus]
MAATASFFTSSAQSFSATRSVRGTAENPFYHDVSYIGIWHNQVELKDDSFMGTLLPRNFPRKKISGKVSATATVTAAPMQEIKEYEFQLPSIHLPGEKLKLFYNPSATKLVANEEYGIAFIGNLS